MGNVNIITGATGLVGSHIAEQLCERGARVRALVRPESDTRFLETLPVEIVVADLCELQRTPQALDEAGPVYHCAAFVKDWGTWQQYFDGTVEITRRLLDACRQAKAGRFLHVSSISVFGNPPASAGEITEDTATGQYLWPGDHYGRAKILAEEAVRTYTDHVIVRPSWIYGRRDLVSLPRLIQALRTRRARIVGSGENLLNLVSATDVARGVVLAADAPHASRQIYHLCSHGEITQREFFDFLSERLGLPRAGRRVPFPIAWRGVGMLEFIYRTLGRKSPPPFTRRALLMLSRPTRFSIAKADRELGWRPELAIREGLDDALQSILGVTGAASRAQSGHRTASESVSRESVVK
jgi:nucleoside-diphosphate-sugar epimerase